MRLFPVSARHRLGVLCTVLALGVAAATSPFAHADTKHLRHAQAQAQHSIKHAQANLDESSKQTRRAYAALNRSHAALRSARHDLQVARAHVRTARDRFHQIHRQLQRARLRLTRAEANLANGQQAVADQHTALVRTVTSFYEEGDPQLVGFLSLLNAQSPADLTRQNEANNVVLDSQDHALEALTASEVLLQVQTQELASARNQVAKRTAQAHANLLLQNHYKLTARLAKARMARTVQERRHAWGLARGASAHDRAYLARSRARAARIHRRLKAEIAREQRKGGGYHGRTAGLLTPPVNGPVTSPYGYRINPIGHYWGLHDGEDFGAACGTPIWAAGNGTVISEYYDSIWGNRLFLNLGLINGKNFTVIYNHLSAYRSSVGEHVTRGQVVGLIGTTGWSTGCHTHFTVMINGVAVNPAPYLD